MTARARTKTVANAASATGYVALVLRISKDKTGRVEGVRNQERWGRAYAERTWPGVPIRVYADNDLSAADDTHRPEFERFREDVAAGLILHVWSVEQSRLERREAEWFRLAAELDAAGITELHTNRDGIVRVRDDVAGIKAVLNAGEVRKLKKRVNDRLDANAAAGMPPGGRPYGYRHAIGAKGVKTMVIVEDEAEVIRECADRILSGWATTNIARDLVARGLTGPYQVKVRDKAGRVVTDDGTPEEDGGIAVTKPGNVTYASVQSWVSNPSVAGKRVHRGEIVGEGNWSAILDEATWQAVRIRLASPRVVKTMTGTTYELRAIPRRAARKYLLSGGVAVCGVCKAHLGGNSKSMKGRETVAYYTCRRGCVGTVAAPLEAHVTEVLLNELDKPAFVDALGTDEHAGRRDKITKALTGIDGQRADLAEMWATREVTQDEWRTARAKLGAEEQRLRAELASIPPPVSHVDIGAIREGWEAMTLDERREIVGMFIETIELLPAARRGAGFGPDRLSAPETWWRA